MSLQVQALVCQAKARRLEELREREAQKVQQVHSRPGSSDICALCRPKSLFPEIGTTRKAALACRDSVTQCS